jgi:hypothetical protein
MLKARHLHISGSAFAGIRFAWAGNGMVAFRFEIGRVIEMSKLFVYFNSGAIYNYTKSRQKHSIQTHDHTDFKIFNL